VRRVLKAPCDYKRCTSLCGRFQLPGVAPPSSELPTSSKMSRTTTTDTLGKTTCYAKTALTHPCATGPWVILPRVIKAALCSHCDVRRSQGAHGGWAPGPWAWPESSSAGRGRCRRWWPCSHVHPAKPAYARWSGEPRTCERLTSPFRDGTSPYSWPGTREGGRHTSTSAPSMVCRGMDASSKSVHPTMSMPVRRHQHATERETMG